MILAPKQHAAEGQRVCACLEAGIRTDAADSCHNPSSRIVLDHHFGCSPLSRLQGCGDAAHPAGCEGDGNREGNAKTTVTCLQTSARIIVISERYVVLKTPIR